MISSHYRSALLEQMPLIERSRSKDVLEEQLNGLTDTDLTNNTSSVPAPVQNIQAPSEVSAIPTP